MRQLLSVAVTAVLCAVLTQTAPATAAPLPLNPPSITMTAADFAEDCNTDGLVEISGIREYVGGVGRISRFCSIERQPGSTLRFSGVQIRSTDGLVAISTRQNDTLEVVDSSFKIAGSLELSSGCCSGGDSLVDERYGRVIVTSSFLTASHIELVASRGTRGGYVSVRDSRLATTGISKIESIRITASWFGGDHGTVDISNSRILTSSGSYIGTGRGSKTYVRDTTFNHTPTVATGPGGFCLVGGNSPSLTCSYTST